MSAPHPAHRIAALPVRRTEKTGDYHEVTNPAIRKRQDQGCAFPLVGEDWKPNKGQRRGYVRPMPPSELARLTGDREAAALPEPEPVAKPPNRAKVALFLAMCILFVVMMPVMWS